MIYTVTFNPAIDYVVELVSFNTGEVNRTQREYINFGGKGSMFPGFSQIWELKIGQWAL